jgi:hypothetical protein
MNTQGPLLRFGHKPVAVELSKQDYNAGKKG